MEIYPYSTYIKNPGQAGASSKGTMKALKKDIDVLGYYVDVMTSGTSKAQKVKGPLGDKYFLNTNTNCMDEAGVAHPRYIYINNIPTSMFGEDGPAANGLVPGILQDMSYINPSALFSVFSQDNTCTEVTMSTRDTANTVGTDTQYILNDDLKTYPPSWFTDKVNPITGEGETGDNKKKKKKKKKEGFTIEREWAIPECVFYTSTFFLFLYIVHRILLKQRLFL